MIIPIFSRPEKIVAILQFHNMKKTLSVLLFLCFTVFLCKAQKPLTNSRQSSYYTYIYKLSAEDVLNFYTHPGKDPDEKILHNPVDSFKTDKRWDNNLPPGNYLKVYAEKNQLEYKLIENHSAYLKLMLNDPDLRFVFLDRKGNFINNAAVKVNQRTVAYDEKNGLYHVRKSKRDTLIEAEYGGVVNFFSVKQRQVYHYSRYHNWFKARWYALKNKFRKKSRYYYRGRASERYTGFMVFNKAKYKPNDTVKFKAFILNNKSKKPIQVPQVVVRLKEDYNDEGKIIGRVNSYRDGAYEYQFVLNDSLKLSLDREYTINLEDLSTLKYNLDTYEGDKDDDEILAKRKVYLEGRFNYEDYELKTIRFKSRTDKVEHGPGKPLSVYLKATDENDLPVPDGRVRLTLTTRGVHEYKNARVFVPDTLWTHQMSLEPFGETKVVIPDSIFPKANIDYKIDADFLNSSNEHQSAENDITYTINKYNITTKINGDTLVADYQEYGKDAKAPAVISALTANDDTISKIKVMLPYRMLINPNAASYSVETDSTDSEIEIGKNESGLSLSGYRTSDSLFVKVNNPNKLHFWYAVFGSNNLIDEGQADSLNYKRGYGGRGNIIFLVNYIWGGENKTEQKVVEYSDKVLTINVKQPLAIYPGQQTETDIVVTDVTGKPVANADVTAWSLTSKFDDYRPPFVPYLDKSHRTWKAKPLFDIKESRETGSIALNWNRWSHEIGLDSITYYQFTHPQTTYRIEEPANDTVTQIAPFVVKDGDIIPVHILYIDNRPVYFSQAEQMQRYSFHVLPGKHNLRFRTATQDIVLDTVVVAKSKKLILSVNADAAVNRNASIKKVSDTLSYYEADLVNKYMITVINNFDWKMATLLQNDQVILLNPNIRTYNQYRSILAGPLPDNYTIFTLRGEKPRLFLTEPGYSYLFEPGLLKQKSISTPYPFNRILSNVKGTDDYAQYALTQDEADTIWQQYLDLRSYSQQLFVNKPVINDVTGILNIGLNETSKLKHPFVKNIIVYRYDDPDYIRIYPGNTTDMGQLETGKYRLLFLLKGDSYDVIDSVFIKPYGTNFYDLDIKPTHPKDSVSIKINSIINNRTGSYTDKDRDIENDALKLKEAFNDKYFNDSEFGTMMSGRVIGSDDKLPVVGCSIRIKGKSYGAVSDVNGMFRLRVPKSGKLVISYIGYLTQEVVIEPGRSTEIKLVPSSSSLNEVVVVGYTTQLKKDVTGSVATVDANSAGVYINQGAPGAATTVFIRGISSVGNAKPLIIIDGVPVENMDGIDPNDIAGISVLKDAAAKAIYGSSAANGVIIINTKKKAAAIQAAAEASQQQNNEQSIRKNFSDYAYWQPKLTTDANGKASFTTTFPDDITNWRTFVIGINDQKQSGFVEKSIKSFKPISASFISPLFAVQGDELSAIGKVMNYTTDAVKLTRTFSFNGKQLKQDELEVKNSKIDTLNVTVTGTDSLAFEYTIKRDNGYFDGERRKIPVIEQGVKETKGQFEALNADTTVNMKFDPALGSVILRAEASVLPALAEEAQRLREYKYLCNEQLASKLKGLLAEKRIRTYLGEPFKYERNINEVIKKLQENRRSQGTWGWWKDTEEELWISLHAIEALTDAQKDGYTIDIDLPKLTDYLVYQLESYRGDDKLTCLELLHKLNAKVDYPKYFGVITKEFDAEKQVSMYNRFRFMLLREEVGLPAKMDSLYDNEKHTLFGNIYWGEDSYRFF